MNALPPITPALKGSGKPGLMTTAHPCLLLVACVMSTWALPVASSSAARVNSEQLVGHLPAGRPNVVCVADFDVESEQPSNGQGPLQGGGPVRGGLGRLRQQITGAGTSPREVVDLMANSLVDDLNRGGVPARRLAAGTPFPKTGWLVRGIFTEVDAGNRLRRAAIGFGAGGTDLQVWVNVSALEHGQPQAFYQLQTSASSRKTPGAVVTKNPYVAAAKFVMSRRDLPRNVRQTAQTIASQIIRRAKA
ncbi:MAG: DUF4410 domain-containing protein [Verrucomicrobia bacterium]|nr:DUF4410 domain-containing protein [Verrucomicrobiota bacterium]